MFSKSGPMCALSKKENDTTLVFFFEITIYSKNRQSMACGIKTGSNSDKQKFSFKVMELPLDSMNHKNSSTLKTLVFQK